MTDKILKQIAQLRASRPIDQRSDTGWDDLSSVRFQIAHTMEKMLTVVEAAQPIRQAILAHPEIEHLKDALDELNWTYIFALNKALAALD